MAGGPSLTGSPLLLERDAAFEALEAALQDAARGRGGIIAIGAEAGGGKTALLNAFGARHPEVRMLWGACDATATPRPLAPLLDIAPQCGPEVARLVGAPASAHDVGAVILAELGKSPSTVLVLEDAHWADEASVDLIRVLSRRIQAIPALLLVSFRNDTSPSHPLVMALGDLASSAGLKRINLPPLSAAAVATLAETSPVDAAEVYDRTGGNPFFVREVLAAAPERIPTTIREAVLARTGRLSERARGVLDTVSVIPHLTEHWLVKVLLPGEERAIEECLRNGVLVANGEGIAFHHELARETVDEALLAHRRMELHSKVLAALTGSANTAREPARIAHHADSAGEGRATLQFAIAAAESAASIGAHRESAAQYARAIRWAGDQTPEFQVDLLERRATECYMTDDREASIAAVRQALAVQEQLHDPRKEGLLRAEVCRILWCAGRIDEAWGEATAAQQLLESSSSPTELARLYSANSMLFLNNEDTAEAVAWAEKALSLAREIGDIETETRALNNTGTAMALCGDESGCDMLLESLRLSEQAGLDEQVARAWHHLAWAAGRNRDHTRESSYLEAGLAMCRDRDLDLWRLANLGYLATSKLQLGHWEEAADAAAIIFGAGAAGPVARIHARSTLALLRARRGDPECMEAIAEAEQRAAGCGQLQHLLPVVSAKAEIAWLGGNLERMDDITASTFELALAKGAWPAAAEIARWRSRAHLPASVNGPVPLPYRLELEGCWAEAAVEWDSRGCSYEAALARIETGDSDLLTTALKTFDDLGATAARARALKQMRARGIRGLKTGPRISTRKHPHGLTRRETEILQALHLGHSNSEIAAHLVLSTRTVDHHVSNILGKLGVRTRTEAARLAGAMVAAAAD